MRRIFRMAVCLLLAVGLVLAPMSAMAASKPKVIKILKVNEDLARLREGPSSEYGVMRNLREGERVFLLKDSKSFCHVRTSTGEIGYVYRGFLSSYGAARLDQIYYAKTSTRVYKSPKTTAKRLGTISKQTHVIVYRTKGDWALIKNLNGATGYCKLSNLQKAA